MAKKKAPVAKSPADAAPLSFSLQRERSEVMSIAFAPDGEHLLTAGWSGVQLWSLEAQEPVRSYRDYSGSVCWHAAVSPDGRYVLAGFGDLSLWLWEYRTGNVVHRFEGHKGIVTCVDFSADGRLALSGNAGDRTMRLWDTASGQELLCCKTKGSATWQVAISPDGEFAVSGGGGRNIFVWRLGTDTALHELKCHAGKIAALAFLPDGRRFLSGSSDKTVRLWSVEDGGELGCWAGHDRPITSIAVSPDGKFAVSGSSDRTVRLWIIPDGTELAVHRGPTSLINRVAFAPDSRRLAAVEQNGQFWCWPVAE